VYLQDSELNDLRKNIELLQKQNSATQATINGVINTPDPTSTNRKGELSCLYCNKINSNFCLWFVFIIPYLNMSDSGLVVECLFCKF